jgi:hypothetical protein
VRGLIWWFYGDLKAYRLDPTPRRRGELRARFDRSFRWHTGFATPDRLLQPLYANKAELLMVLDHPQIPLHTNGSEKRHPLPGHQAPRQRRHPQRHRPRLPRRLPRACKTCRKLGVAFRDYLGDRLGVFGSPTVPPLPDLIRCRAAPA